MKKRLVALLLVFMFLIPAGVSSAATTYYRVNTSSLMVRQFPSESAKVLGSYRRDYALTVKSRSGSWSYVVFSNGFEGYVQTKYITKASGYTAWVTNDDTSLRKGPDGSFAATAKLARGRKVSVLSHGTNYDYCYAGDLGYGYIVNSLLSKKKVTPSGGDSYPIPDNDAPYDAYVLNAGDRRVNLRSYASTNAPIIAEYGTGTKVRVLQHGTTWDKVTVYSDNNTGYMMTKFLSRSAPAPTNTPKPTESPFEPYTAYIYSRNKKDVNVRKGPSTNYTVLFKLAYGTEVTVTEHNTKWDKIKYNNKTGYVQNTHLHLSKPDDVPDPTPTPNTPAPQTFPYQTTITSPDGKSVNFHKKPGTWSSNVDGVGRLEVGTVVTVLSKSKGWAECEYNGYKGYVMTKYLTD